MDVKRRLYLQYPEVCQTSLQHWRNAADTKRAGSISYDDSLLCKDFGAYPSVFTHIMQHF
jgi:hypothetical protein